MLAVYLGARLLYRDRAALNAVGIAALVLLALDPRSLFDASFQLTFGAVLAIAGIGVPLLRRTSEAYRRALSGLDETGRDLTMAPRLAQFRLDLRLLRERLAKLTGRRLAHGVVIGIPQTLVAAYEVLLISIVAQFALTLPMIVYFHRATVLGLPANAVVVPLTGVLMPAAVAALALSYVSPVLAKPAAMVTAWALDGITGSIRVLGGLRAADWRVPPPSLLAALCAVARVRLLRVVAAPKSPRCSPLAGAGRAGGFGAGAHRGSAPTATHAGRAGDHRHRRRPGRLHAGGDARWQDVAGGRRRSARPLDLGIRFRRRRDRALPVVARHHAPGRRGAHARALRPPRRHGERHQRLSPARAVDRTQRAHAPPYTDLLRHASANDVAIIRRSAGDTLQPSARRPSRCSRRRATGKWRRVVRNNDSLVLRIRYRNSAALLPADAEKKIEHALVESAPQPRAELLKVGHNGSLTSSTPEFLDSVRPRFAFISVGYRNSFHHPRPEVLAAAGSSGTIVTFRTDTLGAVAFYLDGERVRPVLPLHSRELTSAARWRGSPR